MFKVRITVC